MFSAAISAIFSRVATVALPMCGKITQLGSESSGESTGSGARRDDAGALGEFGRRAHVVVVHPQLVAHQELLLAEGLLGHVVQVRLQPRVVQVCTLRGSF